MHVPTLPRGSDGESASPTCALTFCRELTDISMVSLASKCPLLATAGFREWNELTNDAQNSVLAKYCSDQEDAGDKGEFDPDDICQ